MFDPAAFAGNTRRESIAIGNSDHPVGELVTSLMAKPVPTRNDLWFVRTKDDKMVITYRPSDSSLCFYEFGLAEFRKHVEEKTLPNIDVDDIGEEEKWIGNVINRQLRTIYGY